MEAVRVYIRLLREGQGMSQSRVANAIGVSSKTVERWEAGSNEPAASSLFALVSALGGSVDDTVALLLDPSVTAAEAEDVVRQWLSIPASERQSEIRSGMRRIIKFGEDDPDQLMDIVNQLRDDIRADPQLLDTIAGYLDVRRATREGQS